ncbi:MAG: carbohydrate-binding protein [Bacillota bacterium]
MATSKWNDDRVAWEPSLVKSGDRVIITYQGLLKNSGASEVYLHYGADGWKNPSTVMMKRDRGGAFSAEIPAKADHELNFCFKDALNNWDNNSGWNWKVNVT